MITVPSTETLHTPYLGPLNRDPKAQKQPYVIWSFEPKDLKIQVLRALGCGKLLRSPTEYRNRAYPIFESFGPIVETTGVPS